MSPTPIEQLAQSAGQAVRDRAEQLDAHRPHIDRLRRRVRTRRALTAGATVVVVVAALVVFVQTRPGSVPVIGNDASPQPTQRQTTADEPAEHDTPEPITDRVRIGEGVYDGGDQPWVMHAWLTEDDGVCIEMGGLGCGTVATEDEPLTWVGTSVQSAPDDKGCAYGPIDEQVAAVEIDFSSSGTVTLSPLDGQQLPSDFYAYCWEGQRQPASVRALDETGRTVASTDIRVSRQLDELVGEQWPAFNGTYEITELDHETGRMQGVRRATIEFDSINDWQLRRDDGQREWFRDGRWCTNLPGPDGDGPDCRTHASPVAPSDWLQRGWPSLIPGGIGGQQWEVRQDGDEYVARIGLRRPCGEVLPAGSCSGPDQSVERGWVVRFGDAGIPHSWYEHADGTVIHRVRFTDLTVAGREIR